MTNELDFVKEMFDRIAPKYDFLNRLLSAGQDVAWRRQMVQAAGLFDQNRVLDAACGTCDVGQEISRRFNGRVWITSMDFSKGMLSLAQKKLARKKIPPLCLVAGDALSPPFRPRSFNAVFIAFGIRNIMNRKQALTQFYRVLSPGGRLAVLELTTPRHPVFRTVYLFYFRRLLPVIGAFFSRHAHAYHYLPASVLQFPSPEQFAGLMSESGFDRVRFKPMTFGIVTLFVGTRN